MRSASQTERARRVTRLEAAIFLFTLIPASSQLTILRAMWRSISLLDRSNPVLDGARQYAPRHLAGISKAGAGGALNRRRRK